MGVSVNGPSIAARSRSSDGVGERTAPGEPGARGTPGTSGGTRGCETRGAARALFGWLLAERAGVGYSGATRRANRGLAARNCASSRDLPWRQLSASRGEDFFNVFALATPGGQIAGRVPKQQAASVEAYLFRGQESSHIIETDLGRVGVGICYDNVFRFTADALIAGDADIAVMSYSAPTPQRTGTTAQGERRPSAPRSVTVRRIMRGCWVSRSYR